MKKAMLALLAITAAAFAVLWLQREPETPAADASALVLPQLTTRTEAIDRIDLIGPGNAELVTLLRKDGQWRVAQRANWPANQALVAGLIGQLAGARRLEQKTSDPALYARIGVDPIAAADAKSYLWRLQGGGEPIELIIGYLHPRLEQSFVRVPSEAASWLTGLDLSPVVEPPRWLERGLVDRHRSLIESVQIQRDETTPFRLVRDETGFTLEGFPVLALANPDSANATAGALEQLLFDDVAADDGSAIVEHSLLYRGVDGLDVTLSLWQVESGTWARLAVQLDEARATAWATRVAAAATTVPMAPDSGGKQLADLRAELERLQARFRGQRFLISPYQSANLLRVSEQYLAEPAEAPAAAP